MISTSRLLYKGKNLPLFSLDIFLFFSWRAAFSDMSFVTCSLRASSSESSRGPLLPYSSSSWQGWNEIDQYLPTRSNKCKYSSYRLLTIKSLCASFSFSACGGAPPTEVREVLAPTIRVASACGVSSTFSTGSSWFWGPGENLGWQKTNRVNSEFGEKGTKAYLWRSLPGASRLPSLYLELVNPVVWNSPCPPLHEHLHQKCSGAPLSKAWGPRKWPLQTP